MKFPSQTLLLVFIAACAVPALARAGHADYKTPVRLHQLAKMDAEVKFVGHHTWRRAISVHYWQGRPYIVVSRDADLVKVAANAHGLLVAEPRHVWELKVPLFVVQGATLRMQSPTVKEVRLDSFADSYATIVAFNSNIHVSGTRLRHLWVHSWNPAKHTFDADLDNGRGSVSLRGVGKLFIRYGTFSYLGFTFGRASGVSVNGSNIHAKGSGSVEGSTFTHNIFGAYTWEAKDMRWTHNSFTHNIVYGFDPHDRSNYFVVKHNYAADNGRHGIIFSRFCFHNLIADNVSVRNGWHGIVIDDGRNAKIGPSARNLVVGNIVRNNKLVGISIDGSNSDVVRDNTISGGVIGIRIFGRSYGEANGNTIRDNVIRRSRWIGILVADPARRTRVIANTVSGSVIGVAAHGTRDTSILDNTIVRVHLHAISLVRSSQTFVAHNELSGAGPSAINKLGDTGVFVHDDRGNWNYPLLHNIARVMSWFIGPGLWALLVLIVTLGPGITWLVERASDTSRGSRRDDDPPPGGWRDNHTRGTPTIGVHLPVGSDESAASSAAPVAAVALREVTPGTGYVVGSVAALAIGWRYRRLIAGTAAFVSLLR